VLCVAGGGAYYFAKKSINADRAARYEAEQKKQSRLRRLEAQSGAFAEETVKKRSKSGGNAATKSTLDHAGSPSSEISEDAAPVSHAPVDAEQRAKEKSKYEAAEPFRSRKGDRFS